jgi:hypothetical protein
MSVLSSLRLQHGEGNRRSLRTRLRVEALEDRRLLATFNPLPSTPDGSPGSLRADIIQANSNGQDNTINLQPGRYLLTLANTAGQENGAVQGDLDLTGANHTITIQEAGSAVGGAVTIIDGGKLDRVFQVFPGVTAIIRNLTIVNGVAVDDGSYGAMPGAQFAEGGGILNAGSLALVGVDVLDCAAAGASSGGNGKAAFGGGIYNSGALTLIQSIVGGDIAQGNRGETGNLSSAGAGFSGGSAYGGGIYNRGSLTLTQSAIVENQANGGAGGLAVSVFFGMPAPTGGQGGDAYGGGLYQDSKGSSIVVNSTIASNSATGGNGGVGAVGTGITPPNTPGPSGGAGGNGGTAKGGGIFASSPFSLYNSTIAANQVVGSNGGYGGAGGLGSEGSMIIPAPNGMDGYTGPAFAGGIWAPTDDPGGPGLATSVSTIIALNTSASFSLAGEPDDGEIGFAGASYTLLEDGSGATGISSGSAGDLVGVDPKLGPLQSNGGPTPTMALLPGSPAFDAGSNPLGLTTDQRGYAPRVDGAAVDIGAYEFGASAPPAAGSGPISVKVKKVKGRHEIFVYDAATSHLRFAFYPFGKSYRGNYQVTTAVINGVQDVVVRRPAGHRRFTIAIFSGVDGSPVKS